MNQLDTSNDRFKDVTKESWYYDAINIASEYDIISGYSSSEFGPMDRITREQAMIIMARAMKIVGLKTEITTSEIDKVLSSYSDVVKSSDSIKNSIAVCVNSGIIIGRGGNLDQKDNITRAEVAVIV